MGARCHDEPVGTRHALATDLIAAALISGLLVAIVCSLVQRWFGSLAILPQEQREIEQREHEEK